MLEEKKGKALFIIIQRLMGEYRRQGGISKRIQNLFEGALVIHSTPSSNEVRLLMMVITQMVNDYRRQGGENEQVYNLFEAAQQIDAAQSDLSFNKALGWTIPPITDI